MKTNLLELCELLRQQDNIVILTHKNPDGDTLGSGFGLYYTLKHLGKHACVLNSDGFPERYQFLVPDHMELDFEPEFVISVDIADTTLLGNQLERYANQIDLCIDHHISNQISANYAYVIPEASSAAELVYRIAEKLVDKIEGSIATALYTGIVTDTGCFKYSNTTVECHLYAAELMKNGVEFEKINRAMFETKSRARLGLERLILDGMEFYFDGKCAMTAVSRKEMEELGADNTTFDGVSAIARQIEGVELGFTIREDGDNFYKISIRTSEKVDASQLGRLFGGGGHKRAAGCNISGTLTEVKEKLIQAAQRSLTN
ncbi:MAG: bifunctional oligoribonuclease/PAP phosphatase NrnA [Massilioclostridium sp.]|nr:MAG: bifunctional oligoribonuclease/PAP phosphatase NrnA [Massilioclostridium sp.]